MSDKDFNIPTNPADITKIKQAVEEGSALLQMMDDRREQLKDTVAFVHEEFTLPKKLISAMIRAHHKQNYGEVAREADTFQVLYETILGSNDTDID